MDRYSTLYEYWRQIMFRNGGVWVTILGVEFNIEEIGIEDDKIDMKLIPRYSSSTCSLLVTFDEFKALLDSVEQKPMGQVAKIKFLLNILTKEFPSALRYSIVKGAIQPIIVSCDVDLPELYPDGSEVMQDEVEKAVNLFRVRLGRIQQ